MSDTHPPDISTAFADFKAANPHEPPIITIGIDPDERPRLLCGMRSAREFFKGRGDEPDKLLLAKALDAWKAAEQKSPLLDPAAPGYLAAAAYGVANDEYLALALDEMDRALSPDDGFAGPQSLESLMWAAIGWDMLGFRMSAPDKHVLALSAKDALDYDLYPKLRELLGGTAISPDHAVERNGSIIRAYAAAFTWELASAEDPETWKKLLTNAHPVLDSLQQGLATNIDDVNFEFINGPVDDALYLAILAWERAAGAELLDRDPLRHSIDKALKYCRDEFAAKGATAWASGECQAALMHLTKWRNLLEENDLEDLDAWMKQTTVKPQALMHILLKPPAS